MSPFFAGIGRVLSESVDFRLGFRGATHPYAQTRYRRPWDLGDAGQLEFRETLFWTPSDHIGTTTALAWERSLSPVRAVRWVQSATLTQATPRVAWSSLLGVYQNLGDKRLVALEGLAHGIVNPDVGLSDYGVQLRWEQPVHHRWLIGNAVLGRFHPRATTADERRSIWAFGLGATMQF